jgi:murein DD-endopeptidase MepM/ murein hydrolase activator NlpD
MMKKATLILVFLLGGGFAAAQPKAEDFVPPVTETPILLAGNVGEIRPNHFHAGIDIKTGVEIGKSIVAAADGYVSRIAVSPTGYGKALYVNHANGTTTVYAHLDRFNVVIGEYVRNEQYRRRSFAVDLYPSAGKLPVKQGELIAWSGDSGSSGGPHLHYEIRDQATQDPLNMMALGLFPGVTDDVAPQFFNLWVIGVDTVRGAPVHRVRSKHPVVKSGDYYAPADGRPVPLTSPGYFAVEVIDTRNGSSNTMGLFTLSQTIDGNPNFGYRVDRFSFGTTRYINTLVHYPLHRQASYDVLRTYVSPNNPLPVYERVVGRGVVSLADNLPHEVVIRIEDDFHNPSELRFTAVRAENPAPEEAEGIPVWWAREFSHRQGGVSIRIPARALYESILLDIKELPGVKPGRTAWSPVYRVHEAGTPLQSAVTVALSADSLPAELRGKACLASVGANGRSVYEGGNYHAGMVSVGTRTFGDFFITTDTAAPRIAARFGQGADLSAEKGLSLTLSDDFSGIRSWSVEIDGDWALFDYDAKSDTLSHRFVDARYAKGSTHTLRARVTDAKGNAALFETTFVW